MNKSNDIDNYIKNLTDEEMSEIFLSEEIRFIADSKQNEFELFYFKDTVNMEEFMYMMNYLLTMENLIMLIRFVYKHSSYILKDCNLEKKYEITEEKKAILIDRINRLYTI